MIAECTVCPWVGYRNVRLNKPCRKCGGRVTTRLSRDQLHASMMRAIEPKTNRTPLRPIVIAVATYGRVLRVPTTTEQCEHLWPGRGW